MMFWTTFFMILYSDISSQPLYENNREDRVTTKQTEFYYQKLYEREIRLENQVNNFKKELDICRDSTLPIETQTTPHSMPGRNITTDSPSSIETQTTPYSRPGRNMSTGSRGTRFIVLFMTHYGISTQNVYITSENDVRLNIKTSPHLDALLKSQIVRNATISSSQHIILPHELELISFHKEVKSVLIETSDDVFVISHGDLYGSAGITTNIPLHKLSTKYVVISTEPVFRFKSQFALSTIEDNTTVTVTFKMKQNLSLTIERNTYYNGDVLHLRLDGFETYQIDHITDLTGTFIESSRPIAAFSGNDCNELENIGACDHLIEQLPPTDRVDDTYIVPPNSDDRDTLIRITAIESARITYVIDNVTYTQSVNKFDSLDTKISNKQTCFIKSEAPILVTSFGLRSKILNLGDPSMTIVPGLNQYLDYYKIFVPPGYAYNYVSIMIRSSSKDSFRINNAIINTGNVVFEENISTGNVTYNVRSIRVAQGELTASTVNGERFGLMVAGVTAYEAYGFSGNSILL